MTHQKTLWRKASLLHHTEKRYYKNTGLTIWVCLIVSICRGATQTDLLNGIFFQFNYLNSSPIIPKLTQSSTSWGDTGPSSQHHNSTIPAPSTVRFTCCGYNYRSETPLDLKAHTGTSHQTKSVRKPGLGSWVKIPDSTPCCTASGHSTALLSPHGHQTFHPAGVYRWVKDHAEGGSSEFFSGQGPDNKNIQQRKNPTKLPWPFEGRKW